MYPSLPLLREVASQPFKRSQLGLFHGKMRQSGNNVPFSLKKTRRKWLPNVQSKRLKSEALNQELQLKVTTRALKTIKKNGGLDKYLENTRYDLLGEEGMRLRLLIRDAKEKKESPELTKQQELEVLLFSSKPDLATAQNVRKLVGEMLGLPSPADSLQTVKYLQKMNTENLSL